jgi:2-isopropylmalate synthase
MIECGHPLKSEEEMERVKVLTSANLGVPVLAHSRAKKEDIDAVAHSGADWIGIFVGINHTTRQARLSDASVPYILSIITESVTYAKSLGLKVRYTVEDASRTSMPDLMRAYAAAVDANADRICFADSVGLIEPQDMRNLIGSVIGMFPQTEMEVHIHDDRGLAMASTLAAIDAGTQWISSAVNGIGERCGITDTLMLLANLHHRNVRPLGKNQRISLIEMSELVASHSGQPVSSLHPVTGANAFTHKARLHRLAMQKDPDAYTWIDPALVGSEILLTEH